MLIRRHERVGSKILSTPDQPCHRCKSIQQRRYGIDKLLKNGFIRPVKRATWLRPIIVVPKKKGRIRVCIDYKKLNTVTVTNAFPLPFTDSVLDAVARYEMYNFLDGFSRYNQVRVHLDDQENTTFITEWCVLVVVVMMFGLKTTPATFNDFGEYIPAFMQVFLNDFAVYGTRKDHLHHLRLCLERCRTTQLSLNLAKCVVGVTSGTLLGHIVSKEGIAVKPGKIDAIIKSPTPKNGKALGESTLRCTNFWPKF